MTTEKIFMVIETEGKEENNFVADYSISREAPVIVPEGYVLQILDVEHTDTLTTFVILDENITEAYVHEVARLYTNKKSLKLVIQTVKRIDGYNYEILIKVLDDIFKGASSENVEIVTF